MRLSEPPLERTPESEIMNESDAQEQAVPIELPMATFRGSRYIIDLRLGEFREMSWPIRFVGFESPEGQKLRWELGIVPCPLCRGYLIVDERNADGRIRCKRCGRVIYLG